MLPSLILVFNPAVQFMFYEAMKRKAGKGGRAVRRTSQFPPGILVYFPYLFFNGLKVNKSSSYLLLAIVLVVGLLILVQGYNKKMRSFMY